MSAPLVVNTTDGTVWVLRTVTREGLALYAVAGACDCPSYLLATLQELAAHGIVGSADVLPVPAGDVPPALSGPICTQAEARAAGLDVAPSVEELDAMASTIVAAGDPLSAEVSLAQAVPLLGAAVTGLRARVAELEALTPASVQTCRKCGAGYTYGEPCSTCEFRARVAAELQARGLNGDAEPYVSRVLPPRDAVCARSGCGHSGADHHHGDTKCWAHLPRVRDEFGAWGGARICGCAGFVAVEDVPLRTRGLRELVAGQREAVDGEHYASVHHAYRTGRDLPETGGAQNCANCGHGKGQHGPDGCSASSAPARCGCRSFVAKAVI